MSTVSDEGGVIESGDECGQRRRGCYKVAMSTVSVEEGVIESGNENSQ